LDEFDFTFQPDLEPRKIRDLATLEFIERHANVALLGPPGVGKTHLASALAVAACQAGYSVYFTSLDDMVRKLKIAEPPDGSTANSPATSGHPSSSWMKWATSRWTAPRRTWSSSSSHADTNAAA